MRSYPISFGLKVQRILPQLVAGAHGKPVLPCEVPAGWMQLMFKATSFVENNWPEAKLMESCLYIRGSNHLNVPDSWKGVFPTHVPSDIE